MGDLCPKVETFRHKMGMFWGVLCSLLTIVNPTLLLQLEICWEEILHSHHTHTHTHTNMGIGSWCVFWVAKSCATLLQPNGLWPARLLSPWVFPGRILVRLPFPSLGDLFEAGIEPETPALAGKLLLSHHRSPSWLLDCDKYFTVSICHIITLCGLYVHTPFSLDNSTSIKLEKWAVCRAWFLEWCSSRL